MKYQLYQRKLEWHQTVHKIKQYEKHIDQEYLALRQKRFVLLLQKLRKYQEKILLKKLKSLWLKIKDFFHVLDLSEKFIEYSSIFGLLAISKLLGRDVTKSLPVISDEKVHSIAIGILLAVKGE